MRFNEVTKEYYHFIMAIVYLHTICAILIVLHESESFYERYLCLETIIKFMHGQYKCNFTQEYALEQWNENSVTCQTRCLVTVEGIGFPKNRLKRVDLRFGYESYEYLPCICLSISFAYCVNIDIYCPPLNTVKVPLGGYCTQDGQCQRSDKSGVCRQGRCVCRTGYILFNLACYAGNRALNQLCSINEQCAGTPHASCLEGYCSCMEGYTAMNFTNCVQTKVPVGGYCKLDKQCQGNEHLAVCELGICVCRYGYVLINLKCHTGNLALNQPCSFNEQCAGTPYASCLEGYCSCIEGYTALNITNCVQAKVPVGGYCKVNEQCQENEHLVVCKLGRCVCKTGYVLYNLECHTGNLALNQSCSFSEQCAGSPYASCLGGKCLCIEGYTTENSTKCVQSQEITLPSSLQHHQDEAKIGTTIGALFGGLLLGVVLTTVSVVIIYRRSKTHANKRERNVTFADNTRCSLANIVDHSTFQNIQTKDKKREVSPYACSEETRIYDNVNSKPRNEQTQEAVYNHLHEQVKQDDDDYYDHACAASAHIGDMGDYRYVQHTTS